MSGDKWNKTHCDKCKEKVELGEGIYTDGGFYHEDLCYEQIRQKHIDDYEWEKSKTSYEIEMVCPHCGYAERSSCELTDDDGENTCGQCDSEYEYTRNVSITYSTTPKTEGEI